MYKRFSCFLFFVCYFFAGHSQLSVSLHQPPSGIVQNSQLWNITLIWSASTSTDVTIGLSLFDNNENEPVMTAFTRPVTLVNGVRQLRASDVGPVEYTYFSPAFDNSKMADAFLPVGNYRACYTIYSGQRNTKATILSEDCFNFDVDPLSPPQLNFPSDSAIVETSYPQFTWLPPTPVILFADLNYDLLVTEVQKGQTAMEAIQANLPIYSAFHLTSLVNNYPASNKSLDTGKVYAWRVIAKNGETLSAQSEVWTFTIASKKPETITPVVGTYLELKNDNTYMNSAVTTGNTLGVKFYSYDKTHEGIIRFTNAKGQIIKQVKRVIEYGNNFLVFKLDHSFTPGENYLIQIPDLQNLLFTGSFRISK
jgi:hypothetical protein